MAGQGFKCNADLILCIDATGSMGSIIERVKELASSFYERVIDALKKKERYIDNFRIKIIVFRDYYCDGDDAMLASKFFNLPDETDDFKNFISAIKAEGGGDEPENALEALALAINSDWVKEGSKKRHIIMIWTDASAHPLEKINEESVSIYPEGMPANLAELSDWWNDPQNGKMNQSARRLIIFAPDDTPWSHISANWDAVVHMPSKAGEGLEDIELNLVLDCIAGSI